jgi:glutathione S-transferase
MLMLEHKGIAYRRVDLLTGPHPLSVRMRGFPGNRTPIRSVDGRAHTLLAMLDRAGTVPALRFAGQRIQTNREIARFLDRVRPQPPLFPTDPERRQAVEEAERWGDEVLQMAARRLGLAAASHGLDALYRRGNDGRLGPLLAAGERMRLFAARTATLPFRANRDGERKLLSALPEMLERIDGWIGAGVLGGEQLNAADFVITPSLALLTYRHDLRAQIEARPAGALVDRVLPQPEPEPRL